MPKKKTTIELDPKLLDGDTVPHPCSECPSNNKSCSYKYCDKWKAWFSAKWNEVTDVFKRKE